MKTLLHGLCAAVVLWAATAFVSSAEGGWVTTWATALQIAEPRNNPPQPGLGGNSLRQIVQVSVPGKELRLRLSNLFGLEDCEILGVEIAVAATMGSSPETVPGTSVSLSFAGNPSVTLGPGEQAVSDPVRFKLEARQNLAITIHYGAFPESRVTSHPGSRTTSYIAPGNTSDFSSPAATTDHWFTISAIDVKPAKKAAGAICVLGDSITDGRGTTTNGQDRWTDWLSRSLLRSKKTRSLSVLNFGLGGNCVLEGGLGPAAQNRYARDLFGQEGVKYIILFEGVNDLGTCQDGPETALLIIEAWQRIIADAHDRGIKVIGATVLPFKGNGYFRGNHEEGRKVLNEWILESGEFDGVIDFVSLMCDPSDPERLNPEFLFENDWLHPNAKGYKLMGSSIPADLFR